MEQRDTPGPSVAVSDDVDPAWWKEAVVYEVYPRSFNDGDGDGLGDIPGLVDRLDYLDDLGVDVVWTTPVYDTPAADHGYDVRDYRAIAEEMGDMADWERLRDGLHARDMRLVMDLVVNHTSDEHEWFERSRRRAPGYEDVYYWRDGDPDGPPPNNWVSLFGGSAWSWDEMREQYYLHLFHEKQPDLNWRTPAVREGVHDIVEWWLERGVDGWRMDAISVISKVEGLPDGDPSVDWFGSEQFFNGPRVHDYLSELFEAVVDDYDVMTIGETPGVTIDQAHEYLADGIDMVLYFDHMDITYGPGGKWRIDHLGLDTVAAADDPDDLLNEWDLRDLKAVVDRWITGLGTDGWSALYLGSHDQIRVLTRFGDDGEYRRESGKLIATFLLTSRATPIIYQGDELGMTNPDWERMAELADVETIGQARELMERYDADFAEVAPVVRNRSRDAAHTPVQWDDSPNAGFTDADADPWLKLVEDYETVNAATARADPDSIWHHYRRLLDMRASERVLVYGGYEDLLPDHEQIFAYTRTLADEQALVVLNWSSDPASFALPDALDGEGAELLVANYDDAPSTPTALDLRPYEALVYRLS
jgi:oligo-1,6-glucosidase